MSVEKFSRHSFFIPKYGGNLLHYYPNKRDNPGDFFPMPKAAFRLGLDSGEIAVLAFLMYCEDRKTYQCHPSYSTIGSAVGMSNNTVKSTWTGSNTRASSSPSQPWFAPVTAGLTTAASSILCNRYSL